MTKQTSTPGYYTIPELTDKDLTSLKYPVHVAKVTSPHIVTLYAEGSHLAMSSMVPDSVDFDLIKQFCMLSRQEEQLLYDFCKKHNVSVLCEVRAPEYNLMRWQKSAIRPLLVCHNYDGRTADPRLMVTLHSAYSLRFNRWATISSDTRTVTENVSLSLAIDLAKQETDTPGILIKDKTGKTYRVDSMEWQCRNKLLWDLSEDLREGRLRRLTYPRLDEREEYYRDRMRKTLEERPQVWQDLQEGRSPLWAVFHALREGHGTYDMHKLMEKMYPDLE